MSGRIRSVKPEWLEDELLALASDAARVLTIGLILQADDYGNGRANPVQLAGKIFPGKVIEHLANALEELRRVKFITLYEVDGQHYFHIRNWEKHQRVDKPGLPRVPGPPAVSEPVSRPLSAPVSAPPNAPEKVPDSPANVPASRASRSYVPDPDPIPDPGPARELQPMAADALRDPTLAPAKYGNVEAWPEVAAVCAAFAATWGRQDKPKHQGDPRARAILERFKEGYTVAQLEAAIRGSKFASHIADNQAHQVLVTILRDAAQVDKFSALTAASKPPPKRGEVPVSPNVEHETRKALQSSRAVREFMAGVK